MRFSTSPFIILPAITLVSSLDTTTTSSIPSEETASLSSQNSPHRNFFLDLFIPHATPSIDADATPNLELRHEVTQLVARDSSATQLSPVTVYEIESNGVEVEVTFTQTFASVPDQWSSPSSGSIGYGTDTGTKEKRTPEPTAAAAEQAKEEKRDEADLADGEAGQKVKREASSNAATVGATKAGAAAGSVMALAIAVAAMIIF